MFKICLFSLAIATLTAAMISNAAHAERGRDGHLKILYWQAVSTVNPYLSGGTKDIEAASLVLEPLARYGETGTMFPPLAADIPTVENGGVAADLMSIHMDASAGRHMVRRHAVHRRRCGVLRRVLPERGDGLQRPLQLHRCHRGRGAGRPHRAHSLRRGQALSLRPLRRLQRAHPAEGAVRELYGRQGANVH